MTGFGNAVNRRKYVVLLVPAPPNSILSSSLATADGYKRKGVTSNNSDESNIGLILSLLHIPEPPELRRSS